MGYTGREANLPIAAPPLSFEDEVPAGPQLGPPMILIEHDQPPKPLPRRELARFLREAAERVRLPGAVTVLLTTDARMQALNREFRRKNKPTDVLSFSPAEPLEGSDETGGDLAISLDIARAQAAELGHSIADEVKILMLHGLLHLVGYDHEQDQGRMARKEARLRRELGLPVGLIQRTTTAAPARKAVVR